MKKSAKFSERFGEVFLSGKWVVTTNLLTELTSTPYENISKKMGNSNSIELIAYHIHYYITGVLEVLEGGKLTISDKYSVDFILNQSEENWNKFIEKYKSDCEKFIKIIESMSDDDFEKDFSENKYGTFEKNINALIEHGYYHLGQIVLIKKY